MKNYNLGRNADGLKLNRPINIFSLSYTGDKPLYSFAVIRVLR